MLAIAYLQPFSQEISQILLILKFISAKTYQIQFLFIRQLLNWWALLLFGFLICHKNATQKQIMTQISIIIIVISKMADKLVQSQSIDQQGSSDQDENQESAFNEKRRSMIVVESNQSIQLINNRLNMLVFIIVVTILLALIIHRVLFEAQMKIDINKMKTNPLNQLTGQQNIDKNIPSQDENNQIQQQLNGVSQTLHQPIKAVYESSRSAKTKYPSKTDLHDFVDQIPYKQAPQKIRQIFDNMIKRDPNKKGRPNTIFLPSEKAYFAYNLYKYPDNKDYQQAQFYYYDKKYNIGKYSSPQQQLPLCIVAPGRNIVSDSKYKRFISSISQQNYTNFKIVYVDDVSTDNSVNQLKMYVQNNHPDLINKLITVTNTQRVYALANRNNGVRNYCDINDIVLDVDADDAFIGHYAFQWVNTIYHDEQVWQANTVFIYIASDKKQVTVGPTDGIPQDLLKNNKYRGSLIWKSSQLRTYRAELFVKIDEDDFKDENGKFYQWASDHFIQQPLTQLSGYQHYRHFYEIFYFYDWKLNRKTVYRRRHYRDIAWTQRPYKPLQSLQDPAQKVEQFELSEKMKKQYQKNIQQGRKQALKNKEQVPF